MEATPGPHLILFGKRSVIVVIVLLYFDVIHLFNH